MDERRDFKGYRIAGAITALMLLVALGGVALATFWGSDTVAPTVAVQPANEDDGGRLATALTLRERTLMQGPRSEFGPSPSKEAPTSDGAERFFVMVPQSGAGRDAAGYGRRLVDEWMTPRGDAAALLRDPRRVDGISSLPYVNADLFEQPAGRDFRVRHNEYVREPAAWVILGAAFLLAAFLAIRGRVKIKEGKSGEKIKRFDALERANHWMTATSFLAMAVTGLIIFFGKTVLIPIIGPQAIGPLSYWSAWIHMAFGPPFALGVLAMIVFWIVDNLPSRLDIEWLKRGGGMLSEESPNPPARKFNAGQKLVFWSVVFGGGALIASGAVLMFPFYLFGIDGMQVTQLVHAAVAALMVAVILGHIYIGTVGMEGAFWAMWDGLVDRNWAKEHHSLWYAKLTGDRKYAAYQLREAGERARHAAE